MIFAIMLFSTFITAANNNQPAKRVYNTSGQTARDLVIDGKPDEDCWKTARWESNFIQYQPAEGGKASEKTEFAILFDAHNMYIAAKCHDSNADSIVKRITRRDNIDGDAFVIQIDSYFDKKSAFSFWVTAAGVKRDEFISNDGNEDSSWDAVWDAKTSTDSGGWYAEIKIPLTQLRFEGGADQTWGLQVARIVYRNQETTVWQQATRKVNGWVSQYGELTGMQNIRSKKIAEVRPYFVARADTYPKEVSNPFKKSGSEFLLNGGVDGKFGITNNLTLDFTINPDFGQVEADPSEVNLTSFETFFQEKRPFFVEGKNIFSFQLALGDGSLGNENLFYSRRVGRAPHYSPSTEDGEYCDIPEFTRIIGAAKISGKTKDGWSLGLLESVTSNEYARVKGSGTDKRILTEPLTNFTIARIQKDFNNGNTILGGMATSVNRNISNSHLDFLHKNAYSGGIDFAHYWHNKDWEININTYWSRVEGSREAITATQKSSAHYFQRGDATHKELDTNRTSLTGSGGKFLIGKMGGQFKFMTAVTWKSPELELNDAGYMRTSDNIFQLAWAQYRIVKPIWIIRSFSVNFNQYTEWTFAGENTTNGGNINTNTTFKNYIYMGAGYNFSFAALSVTALRGGPAIKYPGNNSAWLYLESNEQKKFGCSLYLSTGASAIKSNNIENSYEVGLQYKPTNSLNMSVSGSYSLSMRELQYVKSFSINSSKEYLFARIDQRTFSGSVRVNYNITPDLSLQYWGQPFISAGGYSQFKRAADTKSESYKERFHVYGANELSYNQTDNNYSIKRNSGSTLHTFDNPDFNVKEFLSNMVLRWEYKPGSTLYFVWSQSRERDDSNGRFGFNDNLSELFSKKPNNVFLVKLSYRFGR